MTPAGWMKSNYEKVRGSKVEDALAMIHAQFPAVTKDELGALFVAEDSRRHAVDIRDVVVGVAKPKRMAREDEPSESELRREVNPPQFYKRTKAG